MRLPILSGPLRGTWWLSKSPGKIARVLLGTYEPEQTSLFRQWVRPGDTLLDVGAHAGYYSLLSAGLVGERGQVWSFEPNPTNCACLRRHVQMNGLHNVHVEQVAVSDAAGPARFAFGTGSGTGHLDDGGAVQVDMVTLDDFCETRGIHPTAVKIDVEGAELRVLAGARRILARDRPVVFLSTHGRDVHRECLRMLELLRYSLRPMSRQPLHSATEVIALPERVAAD